MRFGFEPGWLQAMNTSEENENAAAGAASEVSGNRIDSCGAPWEELLAV